MERRRRIDRHCLSRPASRAGMLSRMEAILFRLAGASARPDWTLLAISHAISASVVILLHSVFD
jgi:hypothetical protein